MFKHVKQGETIQNEVQREKDWEKKKMNRVSVNYEIVIKEYNLT